MTKKKILSLTRKNFKWEYYRGSGPGGQHRNKTDTACRCTHPPSGAVASSEKFKSQKQNKSAAFRKCVESEKFQAWLRMTTSTMRPLEDIVDEMMIEENIRVDVKENGRWVVE